MKASDKARQYAAEARTLADKQRFEELAEMIDRIPLALAHGIAGEATGGKNPTG